MNERQKDIQQQAWLLRENGQQEQAVAKLFPVVVELLAEGQANHAVDVLVDISIAYRSLALGENEKPFAQAAYQLLLQADTLIKTNDIPRRPDLDYHLGSAAIAAAEYENGIGWLEEFREAATDNDNKIYVLSTIGFAKVMLGDKEEGISLIKQAIEGLSQISDPGVHQGKETLTIKQTGAMLTLAKVLEDKQEAKVWANKALEEARAKGLGARVRQAEQLIQSWE